MSLKKTVLAGVFWSGLEQFANQIIGFVISIILARLLLPEEFGLIAMFAIFIALGGAMIDSGLTQSLIRTDNPTDEEYSTVFYFNLIGSIVVFGIVAWSAPLLANFYDQPQLTNILRVYSIVFIINAFGAIQRTRLTKIMNFKTQMLVSTPSLIFSGVVGVGLALYGFGVWSIVWSRVTHAFTSSIQFWFWSKWRPLWFFSIKIFKRHFNFGFKLLFSRILDTVFNNLYPIIIGKYFTPAQVGFYSKADDLQMRPVGIISNVVSKITFPLFSEIQNDDLRLKYIYKRIMLSVIYFIAPILIFMAVLAEPMFRFIYTDKWLPAVPYFQILCVTGIMYPIHDYNLQILNVKGRSDLFLRLEIIKKIIISVILLISFQFGIYGLLYGSVVFSLLAFIVNTHYSGKFIDYTALEQLIDVLPVMLLAIISGVIVYIVDFMLAKSEYNDFIRIIIGGSIGTLIFIMLSLKFRISTLFEIKSIINSRI